MGQAKLYNQKQSGIDINGIIQNYYVYAGENVSAGDFVEFINGVAGQTTSTSVDTEIRAGTYTGKVISAVKLDNNRVFIAHSHNTNYYLYGIVVTINGTTIIKGTDTVISSDKYSGYAISIQLLSNGKVFIAHNYSTSYYLYGIVVTINGTTIIKGTDTELISGTNCGSVISTQLLSNGNIFIAHKNGSNYYLYGIVVTISGTTITKGTDTSISYNTDAGAYISIELLLNGNIFIAHSRGSDKSLYGIIVTINGTTITPGTDTSIYSTSNSALGLSTQLLSSGKVFIAYGYTQNRSLRGIVVTISGTTITKGTATSISSDNYSGYSFSTELLSNGKVFIAHSYGSNYYLYGIVVTISGTTITKGTDTSISSDNYSGYPISTQLLSNGTVFIAHSYGSDYYLYAQIIGINTVNNIPTNQVAISIYETQVRRATTTDIYGVAKTEGTGGTSTAHNEQVSIIQPYNSFNLVVNGDFSNGLEGWNAETIYSTPTIEQINGENVLKRVMYASTSSASNYSQTIKLITLDNSHIYYGCAYLMGDSSNVGASTMRVGTNSMEGNYLSAKITEWTLSSFYGKTNGNIRITLPAYNNIGDVFYVKNVRLYDLTAMFGAGNEPTKEWCDENL